MVMNSIRNRATRPDWDNYMMSIALAVATRGSCLRRQVGAVVTDDRNVLPCQLKT